MNAQNWERIFWLICIFPFMWATNGYWIAQSIIVCFIAVDFHATPLVNDIWPMFKRKKKANE